MKVSLLLSSCAMNAWRKATSDYASVGSGSIAVFYLLCKMQCKTFRMAQGWCFWRVVPTISWSTHSTCENIESGFDKTSVLSIPASGVLRQYNRCRPPSSSLGRRPQGGNLLHITHLAEMVPLLNLRRCSPSQQAHFPEDPRP